MKTILCFGDSNSWGFIPGLAERFPREIRWPGVCASILGREYQLIEDCISGRTSVYEDPCVKKRCGADNLGYSLLAHAPIDLVILAVGGNDLKFTDSDGAMRAIARLIDLIRNADSLNDAYTPIFPGGCKILLLGPTAFDPDISWKRPGHALANKAYESTLLAGKFEQVAKEKGTFFFDESLYGKPSPVDCIHLEPEYHKILGDKIAEYIKSIFFEE